MFAQTIMCIERVELLFFASFPHFALIRAQANDYINLWAYNLAIIINSVGALEMISVLVQWNITKFIIKKIQ